MAHKISTALERPVKVFYWRAYRSDIRCYLNTISNRWPKYEHIKMKGVCVKIQTDKFKVYLTLGLALRSFSQLKTFFVINTPRFLQILNTLRQNINVETLP